MTQPAQTNRRIHSIDLLRGIVMIIMALDHVRDYFHNLSFVPHHDPLDLDTTTPLLYFTRWITHFCAPVFVCLSGTSAYLLGQKKSTAELSVFLIKRGLWLIFVELAIITLAWTFNPFYNIFILQVIWAIGISMVFLGIFVRLPFKVILVTGLLILLFHNLLDYPEAARNNQVGFFWDLVHDGFFKFYPITKEHTLVMVYPFLPWIGIMFLGYCLGKWYEPAMDHLKRKKYLLYTGVGMIVLFVLLRWTDGYGDPKGWSTRQSELFTFLSFMNVTKYPPSLLYACATLGPALIFLAISEKINNSFSRICLVYGKVPFFYYVTHLFLIHFICVISFFMSGYGANNIVDKNTPFLFRPLGAGFNLGGVYLIWLLVIILLYPLCKWYGRYKATHHHWWLSYL